MFININGKENTNKAIKAIGQNLIEKADEICNDLERVVSITINAELIPGETCTYNITKNYLADFNDRE